MMLLHPTPIGVLRLCAEDGALTGIYFPDHQPAPRSLPTTRAKGDASALRDAGEQLDAYFAGDRTTFALRLSAHGTPFEQSVWRTLAEIPIGATSTYRAIAAHIGRARSARAVARAIARNPLSIVVPCHRVIGSNGALRGYAGGLRAKAWLLHHESGAQGGCAGCAHSAHS